MVNKVMDDSKSSLMACINDLERESIELVVIAYRRAFERRRTRNIKLINN